MLKIKDNVNLERLITLGFKETSYNVYIKFDCNEFLNCSIDKDTRIVYFSFYPENVKEEGFWVETLYDLISDGIVEKVEKPTNE